MIKIPVHILSGFLGAGKTTFIIRLLGRKPAHENWAIIINEFGKISIDGQTLNPNTPKVLFMKFQEVVSAVLPRATSQKIWIK